LDYKAALHDPAILRTKVLTYRPKKSSLDTDAGSGTVEQILFATHYDRVLSWTLLSFEHFRITSSTDWLNYRQVRN